MFTAVVVRTYRTTNGAVNSEELQCIVVWRKERTLVTVTSDSVPKGRTVNCTARSNAAMMFPVLWFGECPECALLSVRECQEYLSMCVKQSPECLQVSVRQCTECLSLCVKQRPE